MLRHAKHITLWLLFAAMCTSCTGVHDLREARSTVATADSLRAAGQAPYTLNRSNSSNLSNGSLPPDSTSLAFAVTTLEPVRLLFPTDYAHANYYYGRLLREAGDQPEAMLAFLRVIHSRTKDHVIKGRSWSNIGTMCHWAEEYSLSYQMYQKCAQQFLSCSDFVMYYYALNAMAFELARQHLLRESIGLTNQIEQECTDEGVLTKIWETRAEAYRVVGQYDSAIYCAQILNTKGFVAPSGEVVRAQSFWTLGMEDSAVYYAKIVMESPYANNTDKYNVLYILSNNDSTIEKDEIRALYSQRADIAQRELNPESKKLAIAVEYLLQDLERKPDLTWLWAIIATLFIIVFPTIVYIQKQKSKRQLISQQISRQEQQSLELTKQIMRQEQHQQLISQQIINQTESTVNQFRQKVLTAPDSQGVIAWDDYAQMCKIVNYNLFNLADKLKDLGLVEHEIRFCVLVMLKLNRRDCAEWMNLGVSTIGKKKDNIALKFKCKGGQLYNALVAIICQK